MNGWPVCASPSRGTKSVFTEDYKYFTTRDAAPKPRASTPRSKVAHKSVEQSAQKSPKRN